MFAKIRLRMVGLFALLVIALMVTPAHAQHGNMPKLAQLMIGQMIIPNDNDRVGGGDYDIPLIGFAFQTPYGGTLFQYGLEGGALFSWKSDTRSFAASGGGGGGSVSVSLDIEALLADLFFGVYSSYDFDEKVREIEQVDPTTETTESRSDSGMDVGGYVRIGMDLILTDEAIFSIGIRGTKTGLTFTDTTGDVDIEGIQYYAGLSARF